MGHLHHEAAHLQFAQQAVQPRGDEELRMRTEPAPISWPRPPWTELRGGYSHPGPLPEGEGGVAQEHSAELPRQLIDAPQLVLREVEPHCADVLLGMAPLRRPRDD